MSAGIDGLFNEAEQQALKLDLHKARHEATKAKRDLKRTLANLADSEARLDALLALAAAEPPPPIARRERSGMREATPVVLASDLHVEEVVDPATVCGLNEYSPDIARARMARMAEGIEWLTVTNRNAFAIRDMVLWLGGDVITGYIHEELEETNAMSPSEASLFAQDLLTGLINHLLESLQLERLVCPCNYGNHGRTTKKKRHSSGYKNSWEWLLYNQLAKHFADDPRVEFYIARGPLLYQPVYDFDLRFTHGDDVRSNGGVGGVTIPLNKKIAKWDTHREAYLTNFGHFHQRLSLPRAEGNGSLIGTSVYSQGFEAQPPCQSYYLIDSKRGRCMSTPIWVEDAP